MMRYLYYLVLIALLLAACGKPAPPPEKTADEYLQEAEILFEKQLYDDAIANWEKVRERYFSPELNILAELKIAEAYFLAEKYPEAAAAYEDFLKQHPNHQRASDALYRLGLSYYNQILAPDRDQTATMNAMVTLQNLQQRFPQHHMVEEAKELIARCREILAAHEVVVGHFYLRTGEHTAAIRRLSGVFQDYPRFSGRDEAGYYLGRAYLEAGQKDQAVTTFNQLFAEFPTSPFAGKARKILDKNL